MSCSRADNSALPPPRVYEAEYEFWPWGALINAAVGWLERNVPPAATVLDYMCGTGLLLRLLGERRPDVNLIGCDINEEYVEYARETNNVNVIAADALRYIPEQKCGVIVCTGGLHHLRHSEQPRLLAKIAGELDAKGVLLLGEEFIPAYSDEKSRRRSALSLGHSLLTHAIDSGAPVPVLRAAAQVLFNDVLEQGEYKISMSRFEEMLQPAFSIKERRQIWPRDADYGDVLLVCQENSGG